MVPLLQQLQILLSGEMSTLPNSRASPMSDVASETGFTTLSLRDKALIKRNINRQHNSNFRLLGGIEAALHYGKRRQYVACSHVAAEVGFCLPFRRQWKQDNNPNGPIDYCCKHERLEEVVPDTEAGKEDKDMEAQPSGGESELSSKSKKEEHYQRMT
uniref:Uncharacterized protein n=1 Tax=Timema cristinae TaxID=61476 RepID=A0A7R9HBG2_TIMCR|nr:unnamed protein product [Timema cristinae]